MIAVGDRVRVRQLEPGTWASSLSGQEGTVERVERPTDPLSAPDMLVRIDGSPEGGELSWLTVDEVDRRPTVAELEEQLAAARTEVRNVTIGTELLVEAEDGMQRAGGRYTLLVRVERFEASGVWVRRCFDGRGERLVAPFRIVPPREGSDAF